MKVGSSVHIQGTKFILVKELVESHFHWRIVVDMIRSQLVWSDSGLLPSQYRLLTHSQTSNQFPSSDQIFSKRNLISSLEVLKLQFPKDFLFFPFTWKLPQQQELLYNYVNANNCVMVFPEEGKPYQTGKIDFSNDCLVQKYIDNPFLLNNYKFKIRVFALVKGLKPLNIYLFREGIVKFKRGDLSKFGRIIITEQDKYSNVIGNKRTLSDIFNIIEDLGNDVEQIETQIQDIVIKTCISVYPHLVISSQKTRAKCFQLLAFDFVIDSFLNAWLVDTKNYPSFRTSTSVDYKVKRQVLISTFKMFLQRKNRRSSSTNSDGFRKIYPSYFQNNLYEQYLHSVPKVQTRMFQRRRLSSCHDPSDIQKIYNIKL